MIIVRREREGDSEAIHDVVALAFGRNDEADLVDDLRKTADRYTSLVALDGNVIAGHAMLTSVTVENKDVGGACLAPVAVAPDHQGKGIGTALVRHALQVARNEGIGFVVVLGYASYYRRFGFKTASEFGLKCEFDPPEEAFLVVQLRPKALDGIRGTVRYASSFAVMV